MKTIKAAVSHRLSHLCLGEVLPIENLVAYVQNVRPAATRKVITDAASRLAKLGDVEKTNHFGTTCYRLTDKASALVSVDEHHRRLSKLWVENISYHATEYPTYAQFLASDE